MATISGKLDTGMWGKNGPTDVNYNFDGLYAHVEGDPTASASPGVSLGFGIGEAYAHINAALGLKYALGFGLLGNLTLKTGSIDVTYAVDPNAKVNDVSNNNYDFTSLSTTGFKVGQGSLSTSGIDIANSGLNLDLAAKLYAQIHGSIGYDAGVKIYATNIGPIQLTPEQNAGTSSSVPFSATLADIDEKIPIVHLNGSDIKPFSLDYGYGTITAKVPDVIKTSDTTVQGSGLGTLSSSGRSTPFATADFDIVKAVLALFGLPPALVSGTYDLFNIGVAAAGADYTTVSATIKEGASLDQSFSFAPTVDVSLTTSTGQKLTGKLGDEFVFDTPQGEGTLQVDAQYKLGGDLTSNTGIFLNTSLAYTLLQVSLDAGVHFSAFGQSVDKKFALGPFTAAQGETNLGGGLLVPLFSDTSHYDISQSSEHYTLHYEHFVDGTGGDELHLTTHQVYAKGNDNGDRFFGNLLDDRMVGGLGNDTFKTGTGNNTVIGGGGSNVYNVVDGSNLVFGHYGYTTVGASSVGVVIAAGIETLDYSAAVQGMTFDLRHGTVAKPVGNDYYSGIDKILAGTGDDLFLFPTRASTEDALLAPVVVSVDGGLGNNTAIFGGPISAYTMKHADTHALDVKSSDGSLSFTNLENVQFSGLTGTLDKAGISADVGSHGTSWPASGVGDFNADGFSDLLWRSPTTGQVDQWQMKDGHWSKSVDLGATKGANWQLAGVGDFNCDGTSDVLWRDVNTSKVDQWQMKNGNWSKSIDLGATKGADWQLAGVGDFNHDGTSDVLWRDTATSQVDQWQMKNGNWSKSIDLGATKGADWQLAGVGDFNGDGSSDILWRNTSTSQTDLWLMKNGNWSQSVNVDTVGSKGADWTIAGIGDFNGDHTSDILWFNTTTGQLDEWRMANGHWASSIDLGIQAKGMQPVGIGDFNRDGVSDALWLNTTTGHIQENMFIV